jgi:hypothetical protein
MHSRCTGRRPSPSWLANGLRLTIGFPVRSAPTSAHAQPSKRGGDSTHCAGANGAHASAASRRTGLSGWRPILVRSVVGIESTDVTAEEDIASVASQLAELTRTVEAMASDLNGMTERADRQQARADSQQELVDLQQERAQMQQERIDRAAKELGDVSDRLQAAADALRESI